MSIEERLAALERDNLETKRQLSGLAGSFQFIAGQLQDSQAYMHARFDAIDARFNKVDARLDGIDHRLDGIDRRFDRVDSRLDALPRVLAEIIKDKRK